MQDKSEGIPPIRELREYVTGELSASRAYLYLSTSISLPLSLSSSRAWGPLRGPNVLGLRQC